VKCTPLAKKGTSDTALIKDEIQHWVRAIVIKRDGDHARAGLNIRCAIYTRKSSDEGLEQEF
jgi:hypothetical protein